MESLDDARRHMQDILDRMPQDVKDARKIDKAMEAAIVADCACTQELANSAQASAMPARVILKLLANACSIADNAWEIRPGFHLAGCTAHIAQTGYHLANLPRPLAGATILVYDRWIHRF